MELKLRNLGKRYSSVAALDDVDIDIASGELVALLGPSGSGKTTLLNLIGGLDSPSDGSLSVDGKRIDKMGEGQLARWRELVNPR